MTPGLWIDFIDADEMRPIVLDAFARGGLHLAAPADERDGPGLLVVADARPPTLERVRQACRGAMVIVLALPSCAEPGEVWALLDAGARDVLPWRAERPPVAAVRARLDRAARVRGILDGERVAGRLVGRSAAWREFLADVAEQALYGRTPLLLLGETGTGKELVARLMHDLDPHPQGELVIVDCTTLTAELAGSELFGHERGAFTGAALAREGAVARAHGGTLFLDEVGELAPGLQTQLLRLLQEGCYKRVGGNAWQHAEFRLVAATHRDLADWVAQGRFRADLYHRLAGAVCRTPPLRERRDDVLLLARHVQRGFKPSDGDARPDGFEEPVARYLEARDYPGNVRELRNVVLRLCQRHAGGGPLTAGDLPADERPAASTAPSLARLEAGFEAAVGEAMALGLGLRDIGLAATDCAVRLAMAREDGSLQRAARRLGVTDRALQLRRAQQRPS